MLTGLSMTAGVEKGKLWIKKKNLERNDYQQAIPNQEILHELNQYNQSSLENKTFFLVCILYWPFI